MQTSDQGAAVGRGWKLQAIIIWIAVYRAVSLIGVRDDLDDSWFNIVDCFVPTFLGALMRIKGVASLVSGAQHAQTCCCGQDLGKWTGAPHTVHSGVTAVPPVPHAGAAAAVCMQQ